MCNARVCACVWLLLIHRIRVCMCIMRCSMETLCCVLQFIHSFFWRTQFFFHLYFDLVRNMIQMHPKGDFISFHSFIEILVTKFDCCCWWFFFGVFQFSGRETFQSLTPFGLRISIHKLYIRCGING